MSSDVPRREMHFGSAVQRKTTDGNNFAQLSTSVDKRLFSNAWDWNWKYVDSGHPVIDIFIQNANCDVHSTRYWSNCLEIVGNHGKWCISYSAPLRASSVISYNQRSPLFSSFSVEQLITVKPSASFTQKLFNVFIIQDSTTPIKILSMHYTFTNRKPLNLKYIYFQAFMKSLKENFNILLVK